MSDHIVLSYKPEVRDHAGATWRTNKLRFATEAEAKAWLERFQSRWGLKPDNTRISPSVDPVNEKFENGRSIPVASIYV